MSSAAHELSDVLEEMVRKFVFLFELGLAENRLRPSAYRGLAAGQARVYKRAFWLADESRSLPHNWRSTALPENRLQCSRCNRGGGA